MAINIEEEKVLVSAEDFFEIIQQSFCMSKTQIAYLCDIKRAKIQYWEDINLITEPSDWYWLGKRNCECDSYHLPTAKFIFALSCHSSGRTQPQTVRKTVLRDGGTFQKWTKNYESEWQSAFRSGFLIRYAEATKLMNSLFPINITDHYLHEWVGEKYLEEFIQRPKGNKLDLIDLYQMYAVYLIATKAREDTFGLKKRIGDYAPRHFSYANQRIENQFRIDNKIQGNMLIDSDFRRRQFYKETEENTDESIADKIIKCLSDAFPECLSAQIVLEKLELEDSTLDIFDLLLQQKFIEKMKCHVGFGYRVLPAYLKK